MAKFLHSELIDRLEGRLAHSRRAPRARPFVTLTYAQSLDGSISSQPGQMLRLSNLRSQTLTHDLRARHDAILVGINTVLADDPRLTVRLVDGPDPVPIVVDSQLRLPPDVRLLRERQGPQVIVATRVDACTQREASLCAAGARILRLPADESGLVSLPALLAWLHLSRIASVMVEGGARIITSLLSARLADHLIVTVCPVLVGGLRAVNPLGVPVQAEMPPLRNIHHLSLDGDLIFTADLGAHEPAEIAVRAAPVALVAGGGS